MGGGVSSCIATFGRFAAYPTASHREGRECPAWHARVRKCGNARPDPNFALLDHAKFSRFFYNLRVIRRKLVGFSKIQLGALPFMHVFVYFTTTVVKYSMQRLVCVRTGKANSRITVRQSSFKFSLLPIGLWSFRSF